MNESSAQEPPESSTSPSESRTAVRSLATSKAHQLLTLVGFSFLFFEIIFVELYSDNFWFSFDISLFGVTAMLLIAAGTHFFLLFLQSDRVCRWVIPLWKGRPPIAYTRWLELDDQGFTYGIRRVQWQSVDELFLTFFGNLEIRSFALSGQHAGSPDPLFKLPFAVATQNEQNELMQAALAARPQLKFNGRLEKRIKSAIIRGQNAIQLGGAVFMALMLLDVGYSSFNYLEMLKHYHLAHTKALDGQVIEAREHLARADNFRAHPLPISYVTSRFVSVGSSGTALLQARANVLWALGDKDLALADVNKSLKMSPEGFRLYLLRSRLLTDLGRTQEAGKDIDKAIEKHKDSLLPRLYQIAHLKPDGSAAITGSYKKAMDDLSESTFAHEPMWPPGGNRFIHDVFYKDDINFVFDRLLDLAPKQKATSAKKAP